MVDINTVKQAHEQRLMQIDGVEGVGIGVDPIGNPTIIVYISSPSAAKALPRQIGGFEVRAEDLKGPIEALPAGKPASKAPRQ
jgi:hypothetical protein